MSYMIGVDVGGTFTDFSIFQVETGRLIHYKDRSTPADPSVAIVNGIKAVMQAHHIKPEEIIYLAHGTTVATNALIERKGARVGLITSKGFADLMEIGWQKRPSLYDLLKPKPEPILPIGLKCEVNERIRYDGSITQPLDEESVYAAVRFLKEKGAEAIVICTIFSFLNPAHERRIREIVAEVYPEVYVSVSSELVPEFREFSRMSTTVLNAYLGPIMKKYVHNFEQCIQDVGISVRPYVTQSNGSIISISETIDSPIRTAVSGPSAGVVGALYIGKQCGKENIITFDMGGTSADISLISGGRPQLSNERNVEGYPAKIPMIDIATIGAGGGSIAMIDEGGALKVGPRSAGATPGPAGYGRGGVLPTVTDANIALGKLNQKKILGGRMDVRADLAAKAIKEYIADPAGMDSVKAASGILAVVNSNMVRAIRLVSVERGYDAREFSLMAFGGAGPLHACEVAEELGITSIIVPPSPGTLCSLGLLMADTKFDLSRSNIMLAKPENIKEINGMFDQLIDEGERLLDKEGIPADRRSRLRFLDARYEFQNYEISVDLPDCEITEEVLADMIERFHVEHEKNYGYMNRNNNIQIVNYRISAVGIIDKPETVEVPAPQAQAPIPVETRNVYYQGTEGSFETPVYLRDGCNPGSRLSGPAIVEQMDTTIVVPPGWDGEVDGYNNLLLTYKGVQ